MDGADSLAGLFVAALALLVSAWSAWTAQRAFKLTKAASDPAISFEFSQIADREGWWKFVITVTNRSDHLLRLESLEVLRPSNGRLLSWGAVHKRDSVGGFQLKEELPIQDAIRILPLQMSLARAGQTSPPHLPHYGTRDTSSEEVFLFCEGKRPVKADLRLRLAYSDTSNRRIAVKIRRLL